MVRKYYLKAKEGDFMSVISTQKQIKELQLKLAKDEDVQKALLKNNKKHAKMLKNLAR